MLGLKDMKKYNTSQTKFATIIVTLFALAPLAHAAVISGGATTVVNQDGVMHTETKVGASASATPLTGVHTVGAVNTAIGAKMEDGSRESDCIGDSSGKTDCVGGSKEHGTEKAETHANASAAIEKAELHIELGDSEAMEEGKGDVDKASEVHSELDFKHFVAHKAKADAHIKSVDVSDGTVEVGYEESGKWFGFISGTVEAKATADAKGNVEVAYPWYHIFMSGTNSSASLQSEIARGMAAEKKGEKEGVSSTTMRANISAAFAVPNLFEIIVNALHKTSASATATSEVRAN